MKLGAGSVRRRLKKPEVKMDLVFTDRELDLMNVMWEHGPSTAAEVQGRLSDRLAYTTVLTVLRVLEAKGHVTHTVEGKAYRFHPTVSRQVAARSSIQYLKQKMFRGSSAMFLAHVVDDGRDDPETLQGMRRVLNQRLKAVSVG
jgi:predicted transcriptional regulator